MAFELLMKIKRIVKESKFSILLVIISVTMSANCSKGTLVDSLVSPDSCNVFTDDYTADPNDTTSDFLDWNHPALEQLRRRAEIIGNIKWIPKGDVPKRNGFFPQGVEVTGMLYSSVKELDKFVGQEVSFYTFLSAVNNPRSVLYSENVGQPPYHGKNCAAFYGSVCSMTVNYALGLDRPYATFMYGTVPFIKRVANQDLDHVAPGDIVQVNSGHVFLITNIIKNNNGGIHYVDILECAGNGASNRRYTKNQFQERLDNCVDVFYRYINLEKLAIELSPFQAIEADTNSSITNNPLSLNRGDKVTYSQDESAVVVNVLEGGYNKLEVYKIADYGEIKVEERSYYDTPDIVLTGLGAGKYKALLSKESGTKSNAVYFEILQTNVSFSIRGHYVDIRFSSENAIPEYIVFCERNGSRHFIADITDEEKQAGHKLVKCEASLESLYMKVFFKGEYGRVSNSMLPLQ